MQQGGHILSDHSAADQTSYDDGGDLRFLLELGRFPYPTDLLERSETIYYIDCAALVCRSLLPNELGGVFAMGILALIPVFTLFQRYLVEGISTTGLKG